MTHAHAAPEGAGRNDNVHGDETGIDLAPHMESALESVVETIMLFGEYPQPRQKWNGARFVPAAARRQFDLYEWLAENVGVDDRDNLLFAVTTDYSNHSNVLADWQKKIEKMLMDYLAGSEIVREKAEEFAEEEREAA